ncbi:MAG TPA: hypothetical protein PKW35_01285 [Nannocystaceae bacterium]|nr:hypothetical protein [Nannocystaceae bacterium]
MNPLLKKLNFKGQASIDVLAAPPELGPLLDEFRADTRVRDRLPDTGVEFVLLFATRQAEVDAFAARIAAAAAGDPIVWVAYPKAASKRHRCEFNRDTGWTAMGAHGFEPVRQVAIDEDWSALRFRRVEHIKTMTRSFALTDAGKARTATTSRP